MLFKQAIWTLICTKSINMALLTCATKTHVPGPHMKFVKNLEVEESLQVNRFPSCVWKESYQVILLNDLYLKPNRVFCLCHSLRKIVTGPFTFDGSQTMSAFRSRKKKHVGYSTLLVLTFRV